MIYMLLTILISLLTLALLAEKRLSRLIIFFAAQSAVLCAISAFEGFETGHYRLFVIAGLVLLIKVIGIPYMLKRVSAGIKVKDELGMFVKPSMSVLAGLLFAAVSWGFVGYYLPFKAGEAIFISVSLMIMLSGMFLMIFRMQAIAQVVGLLVMENGIFLAGAALSGAVPFFIEIAVSFDIFMCVIILGVFIYRINSLFTHIDVSKLTRLRG